MSLLSRWRADGSPWKLAQPVADLAAVLRRYGYRVGTIGNHAHLSDATPEDHTPFSGSGWPKPNPYPWVHAADVMPPPPGRGLPTLAQLGAQIYADRRAGVPGIGWLKYMNWTTAEGRTVHDAWKPGHVRRASGDKGHIHLSARSDMTRARSTYDPVARWRAAQKPKAKPKPATRPKGPAVPKYSRELRYVPGKPMVRGGDVRTWQAQMVKRGWKLAVDGDYGPKSAEACKGFQRKHRLTVDGIVGPRTWNATWTALPA